MAKLFDSFTIRNVELKNRIVQAPMCMYASTQKNGFVEDFHLLHYGSRAVGQVGLIIVEATAIHPQGRISEQDLGIWSDQHIEGLTKLVHTMKSYGAKTGIQLAHAGRKAGVPGDILAPSPLPFSDPSPTPTEMSLEDIQQCIEDFKQATIRAKKSGFDVIEIHAAHGYLINSFLSPLSNKRQDDYGGSAENRYRFLKEVIEAVRSEWDGPLFVRISASDYHEDGLKPDDYVTYTQTMKKQTVDLIDVSSGGVVLADIDVYPNYQVPFAEKIKQNSQIETGAVGLITTGIQAEEILKNNRADLVFIGRELFRNPYWPYFAAKELHVEIDVPASYNRGWFF